jgi:ABC-type multidrug transport system permease subunit
MSEPRRPLFALTRARVLEFIREPEAVFWVFAFPVIMALVLGFAFRDKAPEKLPVGVTGGASGGAARRRAAHFAPPPHDPVRDGRGGTPGPPHREDRALGREQGAAHLPLRPDPADARLARLEVDDAVQRAAGRRDPLRIREEEMHEKGSRYIDFLLPGILGLNLMGTGIWGIGFGIVNARLKKTLKLMTATPMRKSEYLLAQILSRLFFLLLEIAVILAFGVLAFGVPIRGSLGLLLATALLGSLSFAGLGLLVAARAKTLEAASGLMNLVMVPMWLLSGVFFSAERFPNAVQPLIRALPLTALNDALRAVMLEGKGVAAIGSLLLLLAVWGVVTFGVALKIFRWQ